MQSVHEICSVKRFLAGELRFDIARCATLQVLTSDPLLDRQSRAALKVSIVLLWRKIMQGCSY